MKDEDKTREELIHDLIDLRQRVEKLKTCLEERKQVEKVLQEQREELRVILDNVPAYIFFKDKLGRHIRVNKALADRTGIPEEDWLGKTVFEVLPNLAERYHRDDMEVIASGQPKRNIIEPFETPQGIRWAQTDKIPYRDSKGDVIGIIGFSVDITERKEAEELIEASLREKETLLREIHHRVKNNLQIISALLSLQSKYVKDNEAFEMFRESQNRIKSMALIHDQLYQFKDLSRINMTEYIQNLTTDLFNAYGVGRDRIELKLDVHDVSVGVDTAIPCGLIINELVSNSLKHAFPDSMKGEICICLRSDNNHAFTLTVSDNGIGFPRDLDFRNTVTLGLQLVTTLVEQLKGTIELERGASTTFKITFEEPYKLTEADNGAAADTRC